MRTHRTGRADASGGPSGRCVRSSRRRDEDAGKELGNSNTGNVDGNDNGTDSSMCRTLDHAPTARNDRKMYAFERTRKAHLDSHKGQLLAKAHAARVADLVADVRDSLRPG